jgi:hypothetical protein
VLPARTARTALEVLLAPEVPPALVALKASLERVVLQVLEALPVRLVPKVATQISP